MPTRDGSIELLRQYVNLTESDFRLMIAWLTAAMRPVGPYPILVLNGDQNSGKSTLARILRLLNDPQACPVLALPGSTEDLMATTVNGWLLVYENITAIPGWFSDCVCQLAFGGGFARRKFYTNDERSVIYAQRPVVLVGIGDFVVRGDLRDRSVFLHLPPIPDTSMLAERTFWPQFRADLRTNPRRPHRYGKGGEEKGRRFAAQCLRPLRKIAVVLPARIIRLSRSKPLETKRLQQNIG
jgi:hypothetical protein